jgi:hypothetical protein
MMALLVVAAFVLGLGLPWLIRRIRHGRGWRLPRGTAPRARLTVEPVEQVQVFHERGDGTRRLLYQGRSAIAAKPFFYGHDAGVYTFWVGSDCRGRREG